MKTTKKMTQGAMILAILGALMMANRYIAGSYFDDFAFLPQTIAIILYGVSCGQKEAGMLSFGIGVLTFLFGSQLSWLFYPLAVLAGNAYVYGVNHQWDSKKLFLVALLLFALGEVLLAFISVPLLGLSFTELFAQTKEFTARFIGAERLAMFPPNILDKMLWISFASVSLFTGFLEALLIHFLAIYLLRRFRLKEIVVVPLADKIFPPIYAYMALLAVSSSLLLPRFLDQDVYFLGILCMTFVGAFYLCLLGFLFLIIWGKVKFGRNVGVYAFFFLLINPYFIVIILLIGFLYGTGPLRQHIEKLRGKS